MSEVAEAIRKAIQKKWEEDHGKATDGSQYALGSYGPEWESNMMSLPSYRTNYTPLQDASGRFYFMAGVDEFGDPDVVLAPPPPG